MLEYLGQMLSRHNKLVLKSQEVKCFGENHVMLLLLAGTTTGEFLQATCLFSLPIVEYS